MGGVDVGLCSESKELSRRLSCFVDLFWNLILRLRILISWAGKWTCPNGMPTFELSLSVLLRGAFLLSLGANPLAQMECKPAEVVSWPAEFSCSCYGSNPGADRWTVWPFALTNPVWRLCLVWMTDEKMLLAGILSTVFIF